LLHPGFLLSFSLSLSLFFSEKLKNKDVKEVTKVKIEIKNKK
jgi:hypothetical protein